MKHKNFLNINHSLNALGLQNETDFVNIDYPPVQKQTFKSRIKKTAGRIGEIVKSGVDVGRRTIEKEQLKRDFIRHLTDKELEQKAMQIGKPRFGGLNPYERELKHRILLRQRLSQIKSSVPRSHQSSGINFGFLNPISTLKPKQSQKTIVKQSNSKSVIDFGFLNPFSILKSKRK